MSRDEGVQIKESVDSFFKTINPNSFHKLQWTIENYSDIRYNGEGLRSPEFKALFDTRFYAILEKKMIKKLRSILISFYYVYNDRVDVSVNVTVKNTKGDIFLKRKAIPYPKTETSQATSAFYFPVRAFWPEARYTLKDPYNYYDLTHFPKDILVLDCKIKFSNYATLTKTCSCVPEITSSECLSTLSNDMKKIYDSSVAADINLKIQGSEISAHKAVLIARSDVFYKMFQNDTKENSTGVVEINDCEPRVFKLFLEYMYSGVCPTTDFNSAQALYRVSDKYCVSNLKQMITTALSSHTTVENAVELLFFAHLYKDAKLQNDVVAFIKSRDLEFPIVETVRVIVNDERCDSAFGSILKALFS